MFDFVGKKWLWFGISIALIIPCAVFLLLGGLKLGIDFTGGSELELRITNANNITEALQAQAETEGLDLEKIVPAQDNHLLLRFKSLKQDQVSSYVQHLDEGLGDVEQVSFITVGPTISGDLNWRTVVDGIALPLRLFGVNINSSNISQAIGGVFWASLAIAMYIVFAFRKIPAPYSSWAFGFSVILALVHDVLIVLGVFAVLGYFYNIEIDVSFVTALLTVIGFSVHDTIVVFDRVRENVQKFPEMKFGEIVNISVAETAGRSISTSITVFMVLLALFLLGGETIRWFVFALLVGIVAGTYSSIFNAAQILTVWEEWRERTPKKKKQIQRPTTGAKKSKKPVVKPAAA
jgi:preprotein translocase subunit SecF